MNREKRRMGPQTVVADRVHAEKYRAEGEDFREAMNRVAAALKDDDTHFHEFRDIIMNMRFLPGGRIQASAGAAKRTTAYNCFVSGTIADSFVHDTNTDQLGGDSIMGMATEAAATMRMGGGIGYDFSTLRPSGDPIRKLNSTTDGPIAFMEIFDAVCRCVASSGHRRGAQMGVLRVDHPDVEKFVHAKTETGHLTGFNISLAVTDKFMECLDSGRPFQTHFGGRTYAELDAAALWEQIMRATWDWAEPGVLFIDAINRKNNLWYCETIAATNPCGEQPLPPYGACLLGSFNLVSYLRTDGVHVYFDWDQFGADVPPVVRAMDNVVDRSAYPLPQHRTEAMSKRRMGLGVTGLANAAETMGMPYGSPSFLAFEAQVLDRLARETYRASALLAAEKGPFPLFDRDQYLKFGSGSFVTEHFMQAGDEETTDLIWKHGIRNSHLTSIAPTGTISLSADNISSGIEPVFSYFYDRKINMPEGPETHRVEDWAYAHGVEGKPSSAVTIDEHVNVLVAAARRVDSAVSKTCNLEPNTPWNDFKSVYTRVWEAGGKGCTTFNTGGKRGGILVAAPEAEQAGGSCEIGPDGRRDCA